MAAGNIDKAEPADSHRLPRLKRSHAEQPKKHIAYVPISVAVLLPEQDGYEVTGLAGVG
jgi:hypothetical protein